MIPGPIASFSSRRRRQSDIVLQLQLRLRIALARQESNAQIILNGKHAVVRQVLAAFVKDLCCEVLVVSVANYKVDVRWTERLAVH